MGYELYFKENCYISEYRILIDDIIENFYRQKNIRNLPVLIF